MHLATSAGIRLIDCQLENPHLMSLGATLMPRDEFLTALATLNRAPTPPLSGSMSTRELALIDG